MDSLKPTVLGACFGACLLKSRRHHAPTDRTMPKATKPLTNIQCQKAIYNPAGPGNKLADGGGLYLELLSSGSKAWRHKYINPLNGKENRASYGLYPEVSLNDARAKRDATRSLL